MSTRLHWHMHRAGGPQTIDYRDEWGQHTHASAFHRARQILIFPPWLSEAPVAIKYFSTVPNWPHATPLLLSLFWLPAPLQVGQTISPNLFLRN